MKERGPTCHSTVSFGHALMVPNDIHEINLHQTFDTIHSNLLHDMAESNANSSKFITNIDQNDDGREQKIDNSIYDDLPTYEFGTTLTAGLTAKFFNEHTKYSSLKDEFLSNKLYNITNIEYLCLYQKAENWINIYENNLPKVVRESPRAPRGRDDIFRVGFLKIDEPMSIQHVMVLMSYTNNTELQRAYKRGFRKRYKEERQESLSAR